MDRVKPVIALFTTRWNVNVKWKWENAFPYFLCIIPHHVIKDRRKSLLEILHSIFESKNNIVLTFQTWNRIRLKMACLIRILAEIIVLRIYEIPHPLGNGYKKSHLCLNLIQIYPRKVRFYPSLVALYNDTRFTAIIAQFTEHTIGTKVDV